MITSGVTASATSDFASIVRSLNLATFVGEETGGSYLGNTSKWEFDIVLPNTKKIAHIPLARYFINTQEYAPVGRGVIPDFPVNPKIEDLINGVDTQLEYTRQLILKGKL